MKNKRGFSPTLWNQRTPIKQVSVCPLPGMQEASCFIAQLHKSAQDMGWGGARREDLGAVSF